MNVRRAIRKRLNHRLLILQGKLNRLLGTDGFSEDVSTYKLMLQDNVNTSNIYQAGKFWARLNRYHNDIIYGGGLVHLRNQYFNRTFAGPEPESRQVYRALLFLYYKKLIEFDTEGFLKKESEPLVGGSEDQEIFDDHAVSLDFLQSVEEAYLVRKAWDMAGNTRHPRVIVELGAGYGRLAYVCRKMMPNCTYVILDLPEALTCSASWLSRVLHTDVVPYAKSRTCKDFSREKLLSEKVWILGAHQIEALAEGCADAFVNIYSFAEMPTGSINNYFTHIDKITRGVFYSKQRKLEHNIQDGTSIGKNDYPVKNHWRMLFNQTTTLYENFFESAYALNTYHR